MIWSINSRWVRCRLIRYFIEISFKCYENKLGSLYLRFVVVAAQLEISLFLCLLLFNTGIIITSLNAVLSTMYVWLDK